MILKLILIQYVKPVKLARCMPIPSQLRTPEHPDPSNLAQRYLYAFGAQCKVVKWRQAPPSPVRRAHQQAVKVARAQANQQGLTPPKTPAVTEPVSARSRHRDGASTSKVAPASLQPSSKRPPSSPPDDPVGKRSRASSPV